MHRIKTILIFLAMSLAAACAEGDVSSDNEPDARPEPVFDMGLDDASDDRPDGGLDPETDASSTPDACVPTAEACNGLDDDCDGEIDEDFAQLGSDCSAGTGSCFSTGTYVCGTDGAVVCTADPGPISEELCGNGIDDDCDGEVDEGFESAGDACSVGVGACAADGVLVCNGDGTALECDASAAAPSEELCGNGVDDDCDGEIDEGFETVGDACTSGTGVCETTGTITCSADGTSTTCDAVPTTGSDELCGNGLDDDCDGDVDEGFELAGMPCSAGVGACQQAGIYACSTDLANVVCDATPGQPSDEVCGDGVDNDCDGTIDDGFPTLGMSCESTFDRCSATGTIVCDGTGTTCDAVVNPTAETCDGTDQDCDGDIDEDAVCGACQDDGFEVNDFEADAAQLPAGVRHELTSCFTDPDWFALDGINSGETILINATFVDLLADLDLRLLDPSGTTVAASLSATDDEQIAHVAGSSGTYRLEVRQIGPKAAQDYTLFWSSGPAPSCVDDAWESNDTLQTAAPLPLDRTIDAEICPGNVDYYDLGFLTRGFGIAISMQHLVSNGDLDMRLYRYDGEVASATTTTDDETIVFWPDFGGEYVLAVEGDSATDANSYTLTTMFAGGYLCSMSGSDSANEPDDSPAAATNQSANDGRTAAICGTDDWIRLPNVAANDTIVASLLFDDSVGDLDLWIYPDLGAAGPYDSSTLVAASLSNTDNEHIRTTVPTAGDYLARIDGYSGSVGPYRFAWDIVTYACDDPFEPNNRFASFPSLAYEVSTRLEPLTSYSGTLCTGDIDNFELGLIGVGRTITATVVADSGAFEVELFDGLTGVASDTTTGMTKVVTWTTTDEDDHTLAIRPTAGTNLTYDVSYEVD